MNVDEVAGALGPLTSRPPAAFASYGTATRISRLVGTVSHRIVLLTLDATLFSGPDGHLSSPARLVCDLLDEGLDAILGFPGLFTRAVPPNARIGRVVNGTASTTFGDPAHKVSTLEPSAAIALGADAVGLHVLLGHQHSHRMLERAAGLIAEFSLAGIPTLVAAYVTSNKSGEPRDIIHAARIAVDLGADLVKTAYTGDASSYARVVEALDSVPLLVAGGPLESLERSLTIAQDAMTAGATGVAFGRTVFESASPPKVLRALHRIVHEDASTKSVLPELEHSASLSDHIIVR